MYTRWALCVRLYVYNADHGLDQPETELVCGVETVSKFHRGVGGVMGLVSQ